MMVKTMKETMSTIKRADRRMRVQQVLDALDR